MRTIKFTVAIALVAMAAKTVSAISPLTPSETYRFTANPDFPTTYDGSTITLQGTSSTTGIALVDWNLAGWSGGPVKPSNSTPSSQSFSFYDPSTFYGSFDISGFSMGGEFFFGSNSAAAGGFLQLEFDPPGVWSPVVAAVPDSGTTLMLLAMALGGLAAARRSICARA
jgi:hypothetical protein